MKSRRLGIAVLVLVGLLFIAPGPSYARWSFFGRSRVVIPFRIVKGIPVVSLSLNGRKGFNFVFDTGAVSMTLSPSAVAAAGLRTSPVKWSVVTPCGASSIHRVVPKMRVSGYGMEITGNALVADLSKLSLNLGVPIAGILGFRAMLPQFPMLIDYRTQRITFFPARKSPHFPKSEEIPLRSIHAGNLKVSGPVITAELELPDGKLVNTNLEIDTGGGAAGLQLNTPFAKKYDLLPTHPTAVHGEMTLGEHTCRLTRASVTALIIGEQKIAHPDAFSTQDPFGTSRATAFDGQIGAAILSNFRIFFSAQRHYVVFETAPQNPPKVSRRITIHSP